MSLRRELHVAYTRARKRHLAELCRSTDVQELEWKGTHREVGERYHPENQIATDHPERPRDPKCVHDGPDAGAGGAGQEDPQGTLGARLRSNHRVRGRDEGE